MVRSRSGVIRTQIGNAKTRLSEALSEGNTLLATEIPDAIASQRAIAELEDSITKMDGPATTLSKYDKKWTDIIESLEDADANDEEILYASQATGENGYLELFEEAQEVSALLNNKLRRARSMQIPKKNDTPTSASGTAKLPKIILPQFDGNPIDWNQFITIHTANVRNNSSLTNIEKLTYLRSQLTGVALAAIGGLEITDHSYDTALEILKSRFERTSAQIVGYLYAELKKLPISSERSKELRYTHDRCEAIFRQLKTAGEDVDSTHSLTRDIMSKYPSVIIKDLIKRRSISSDSTAKEIQEALRQLLAERDQLDEVLGDLEPFRINAKKATVPGEASSAKPASTYWKGSDATSALTTVADTLKAMPKKQTEPASPCHMCGGAHYMAQCQVYVTAQQRLKRLEAVKRCGRCFSPTHTTAECRTSHRWLRCFYCKQRPPHKSALCPVKFGNPGDTPKSDAATNLVTAPKKQSKAEASTKASSKTSCGLSFNECALLPTATTTVTNPKTGKGKRIRLVLDSGSHRSYITEQLVRDLDIPMNKTEQLRIAVFGSNRLTLVDSHRVNLNISLRQSEDCMSIWLNTSPIISDCDLSPSPLSDETQRQINSIKYALADEMNGEPLDMLIGTDYMWCFVTGNALPLSGNLYLLPTSFGLVLSGRYETEEKRPQTALFCLTESSKNARMMSDVAAISTITKARPAIPDIDEFWALEKIGIHDNPTSSDDERAHERFTSTVCYEDGRYQVCWPWNDNKHQLRSNYQMALNRLNSLGKRLRKADPKVLAKYAETIAIQQDHDIIERVPTPEILNPKYAFHYLAHHPVIKSSDTTAVRIVYDASAKENRDALSLNECMYRGTVILPDLCSILIRFRLHRVALVADIEKAFLQLGLQPSERDVTRFLWFDDTDSLDPREVVTYRFKRVPFGVVSSPFLLGATIKHHMEVVGTPTASKISEDIYVDNVITGTEDEAAAIGFYLEAKTIFRNASMNLREWSSNSHAVVHQIPSDDQYKRQIIKVLGMNWHSRSDEIWLRGDWKHRADCSSKREILQAIASIYDPLGLFQPCTLQSKCFLRKLWNASLTWDEKLNEELRREWITIHKNIQPIFDIRLPRYASNTSAPETTLVAFCDASASVYATCVYLRTLDSNQQYYSILIYAKSRLAPKSSTKDQNITIPRLELLGLTIAAAAVKFIRKTLMPMCSVKAYVMCDSTIALGWIRSAKLLPVFVANRVKQIQDLDNAEFHHVAGNENPADLCTRGLKGQEIQSSSVWWNGPSWLKEDSSEWPTSDKIDPVCNEELLTDGCSPFPSFVHCLAARESNRITENWFPFNINPRNFSSFRRLLRITVTMLKFIKWAVWDKISIDTRQANPGLSVLFENITTNGMTSAAEWTTSKCLWIKAVQDNHYREIKQSISSKTGHPLIRQLDLYIDADGLIRCVGRLKFAELAFDTIRPKLMPGTDHVTRLIIEEAHQKLYHSGVSHTLNQIRREYWIPKGRNAIRKVLTRCRQCRKSKGPPFALPRMPPWPRERIAKCSPFEFCGVDYFGPINVAQPCKHDGTEMQKMWVCLLTCLSTRAIHLEPVMECTATSFIDCLSRFISRRGAPKMMISDNAPQFRLAKSLFDRTWHAVLTDHSVQSYIADKGMEWKFTTALAPWQGGVYERMVGIVKSTFRSAIGRRLLKFEEFTTVLAEIESIVNSRPLTYVYSDIDSGLALRPIDFITSLRTGTSEVDPKTTLEAGDAARHLLRHWKAKQQRLGKLWRHFYEEYVTSLRERGQDRHRNSRSQIAGSPTIDEVVLVKNPEAPRGAWKLGKVTRIIPGRDGLIRSVELLLPNKMTIERSIAHIYPLEIPSCANNIPNPNREKNDDSNEDFEGFEEADIAQIPEQLRFLENLDNETTTAVNRSTCSRIMAGLAASAVTVWFP